MLAAQPAALWQIRGDLSRVRNDTIVVYPSPKNPANISVRINGKVLGTRRASRVSGIEVNGLKGNDHIEISLGRAYAAIPVTVNGGPGNDLILGGAGNEMLTGGAGNDEIHGGMGNDRIYGGASNDLLAGDEGNDLIDGSLGNDTEAGGLGDDNLIGGKGNDQLSGGWGEDDVDGEAGNDVLRGGAGADDLNGGSGRNILYRDKLDRWHHSRYDSSRNDAHDNPLVKVADGAAMKRSLIEAAVKRWKRAFGQSENTWLFPGGYDKGGASAIMTNGAPPVPSHSDTNVQVQGVDEADLVKTDGKYLYLLDGNTLLIMTAWPADQTKVLWQAELSDSPDGIYLDGDRLTVISRKWESPPAGSSGGPAAAGAVGSIAPAPRVAGDIAMPTWGGWWGKAQAVVTVYDVSDRAAPKVVSQTTVDGSLASSRDIDGRLYMVLDNGVSAPEPLVVSGKYENEAVYRARLEAMSISDLLPQYASTGGSSQTASGALVSAGNLWMPAGGGDPDTMFTIALFDLNGDAGKPLASTSAIGVAGTVYASANSMYVTSQAWDSPMGSWEGDCRTDIYRFSLGATSVDFTGTGSVPGWTVDQFAMDENKGYFRIATTTAQGGLSNNVFVMDPANSLKIVGSITELAMTERIYAARFVGDAAYLVTFRQVDPLFAIDLSNPALPQLKGVLEMPGYSSYLHPAGDRTLIGFGRDADASGRVRGLQVSLFDVSNLASPRRVGVMKLSAGGSWSGWSAAEWDHHAFSYFPEEHVLALPVLDRGWWNNDAKLDVIKVDEAKGLTMLGQIRHHGQVLRSVRIGGYIYSIGSDAVKVVAIADPGQVVADVPLPESSGGGPMPIAIM